MTNKPCEQKKCELLGTGHCPMCICGAKSDEVSDTCEQCWCCSHDAGYIRHGENDIDKAMAKMIVGKLAEEVIQKINGE
jgi:hypothetical protein